MNPRKEREAERPQKGLESSVVVLAHHELTTAPGFVGYSAELSG